MRLRWLHRLLEAGLHFERRFEPFFRPAANAVFRKPVAAMAQWAINIQRRDEGLAIAEERIDPDEEASLQGMIDAIRVHLEQDFPPGEMERGGNTKTHGLVRAEFVVHDGLPEKLRRGVFAEPRSFTAWVRFSGPGPHVEPDIEDVGFVSISVKLMGVEGPKLMEEERFTQDFTAVCTPTFVTPTTRENAKLQEWSRLHLPIWYFLNPRDPHVLDFIMQGLWNETQTNPLGARFYSCVPYLLGDGQAMKYAFRPKTRVYRKIHGLPFRARENYLRDNMVRTLTETDVEIEMTVQLQTDPHRMPIEHAGVLWSEKLSPPIPVATIRIPRQAFDSEAQFAFCRNLRFNPWHCLPDHRPLGNQSRARRRMYHDLAVFRQRVNGVEHVEPTGDELF